MMHHKNVLKEISELSEIEIDSVNGAIAPFLVFYFGAGFALGVTSAIAAYAATHK